VAVRDRVLEKVALDDLRPRTCRVLGQSWTSNPRGLGQVKPRPLQLRVAPQDRGQPRASPAAEVQNPLMPSEVVDLRKRRGRGGLNGLDSLQEDLLLLGGSFMVLWPCPVRIASSNPSQVG
jgi:hypothetical protein